MLVKRSEGQGEREEDLVVSILTRKKWQGQKRLEVRTAIVLL